ncbi:MAG: hypothetical protein GX181_06450 [Synergistaceae bacterium]|nr:hypothetical protein [Synergistota bacterium]NLM71581.1 hypothetical protein [Synergistaceae bacterium]
MKRSIVAFFVFALAFALLAAPVQADDGRVKGLWIEIPGLPEACSTSFNVQSGGEGEAYFERNFDGGILKISIDRIYSEDRDGEALTPSDTGSLVVMLQSLREFIEMDSDDIDVTEFVEELEEVYSYPVSAALYTTGEDEDMRGNQDIFIFTEEWIFRVHISLAVDHMDDYDADALKEWLENMEIFDREEGRGDLFDDEDDEIDEEDEKAVDFVAVVYSLPGFRGIAWQIAEPGEYDLFEGFDMPNDSVRSLAVCPGYRVALYEHSQFDGESAEYEESEGDLSERGRWASSIRVEQIEEPDVDLAFEWFMVQAENEGVFEEVDLDTARAAKAMAAHGERIGEFKAAWEMHWYGTTTDSERVELGGELIRIFSNIGVDTDDWDENSFAQAMNNFYDWRKDLSVWDAACMILNVDPEIFEE